MYKLIIKVQKNVKLTNIFVKSHGFEINRKKRIYFQKFYKNLKEYIINISLKTFQNIIYNIIIIYNNIIFLILLTLQNILDI